jgi:hypothetical protein
MHTRPVCPYIPYLLVVHEDGINAAKQTELAGTMTGK